ncbi:hypothetical protein PIB30_074233 [Stylosanthes scabra]|uniref:Uncharacterized protein n=1 Tax=Stylosanthes scabra TaxID=79078 RepID=A0ABU6UQQ1_9FABA|nr:hypothetical protein [Stylosanthes scabra]
MKIPNLSADVHLHAIKSRLWPGKFQETIAVNKPKTLAELREKAQFEEYTQFNTKKEDIIKEILRSKLIKPPKNAENYKDQKNSDRSKYCNFHQKHGQNTEDCVIANDLLEHLAPQGHLDKYIDGHIFKTNKGSPSNIDKAKKEIRATPRGEITFHVLLQEKVLRTQPERDLIEPCSAWKEPSSDHQLNTKRSPKSLLSNPTSNLPP